jgi:phosphoribosyl-ATP pyrophosphohydrolase
LPVLAAKLAEEAGEVCKEAVMSWEDELRPRLIASPAGLLAEIEDVLTVCMVLVDRAGGDWASSVDAAAARFVARFDA